MRSGKVKKLFSAALIGSMVMGTFVVAGAEEAGTEINAETPVEVTGGLITGTSSEDGAVTIYKGIPYAAPPVGDLRWKAPQPVENWDDVLACDTFSAICPQSTTAYGDFQPEFYSDPYPEMSEDCLYLNVWTPAKSADEKLPVMVYIHGGGNGSGWGYEKEFDGEGIAAKGCILVTLNYRLGVFGFLAHEDLAAEADGCTGNYGLMDQAAAFEWVRDNIAAFGGDPENVTMFGQSAGAMDMTALVCSEKMDGLVDHAIFQSGGFLQLMPTVPVEEAEATGSELTDALGMTIEEMRAMDDMDLYNAVTETGIGVSGLCVDGALMTKSINEAVEDGSYLDIDYVIGSNSDEFGGTFAEGVTVLGERQLELGRKPAYCYLFTHFIPGIDDPESTCYGAFHTGECWYIFETLDRCWRQPLFTDADYELADMMAAYWTNFAKTGDPNGESVPEWAPYTEENKNIQVLDVTDESAAEESEETAEEPAEESTEESFEESSEEPSEESTEESAEEEVPAEAEETAIPTAEESIFIAPLRPENAQQFMDLFAEINGEDGKTSFDLAMLLAGDDNELGEDEINSLKDALDGFDHALSNGYLTDVGSAVIDADALGLEDGTIVKSIVLNSGKPVVVESEVADGICSFEVTEPSVCFAFTE